jgi:rod shape-determining protein MreC
VVDFVEVSKYAKIERGDTVNVAGFSHYFPRGVRVGTVEEVELAENGTSFSCKVRLAADMGRLYNVVLVRNTQAGEARELEEKRE